MMETRHGIFFVLFGLCLIRGTNGLCDSISELQKCMDVLGVNLNEISGKSPSWNRTKLEHVCGSVDKFFTCYNDFAERCHDTELGKITVVLNRTLNYMCRKERELYLKTRVCMSQADLSNKLTQCTAMNYDSIRKKDKNCNINLKICAHNAVASCGEDGKKYIDGFMNEVIYEFIDCRGTIDFCDRTLKLQKCLNVLLPELNLNEISEKFPLWNQKQLEHVCRSVEKFFTCYDDVAARCGDTELGNLRVVLSRTFSYMCGNVRELYLKTLDCLKQVDVSNKLQRCNIFMPTSNLTKDETCDKIEDLTNCAQNTVSICGADAEKYMDGFVKDVTYKLADCDNQRRTVIIIIASVIAVVVIISAILTRALFVKRRKKSVV